MPKNTENTNRKFKKISKNERIFFPTSYKFGNFSNNLEIFGIIDGLY